MTRQVPKSELDLREFLELPWVGEIVRVTERFWARKDKSVPNLPTTHIELPLKGVWWSMCGTIMFEFDTPPNGMVYYEVYMEFIESVDFENADSIVIWENLPPGIWRRSQIERRRHPRPKT